MISHYAGNSCVTHFPTDRSRDPLRTTALFFTCNGYIQLNVHDVHDVKQNTRIGLHSENSNVSIYLRICHRDFSSDPTSVLLKLKVKKYFYSNCFGIWLYFNFGLILIFILAVVVVVVVIMFPLRRPLQNNKLSICVSVVFLLLVKPDL